MILNCYHLYCQSKDINFHPFHRLTTVIKLFQITQTHYIYFIYYTLNSLIHAYDVCSCHTRSADRMSFIRFLSILRHTMTLAIVFIYGRRSQCTSTMVLNTNTNMSRAYSNGKKTCKHCFVYMKMTAKKNEESRKRQAAYGLLCGRETSFQIIDTVCVR